MAAILNYAVQSELLVWLLSSVTTLLYKNEYHNIDAAIKVHIAINNSPSYSLTPSPLSLTLPPSLPPSLPLPLSFPSLSPSLPPSLSLSGYSRVSTIFKNPQWSCLYISSSHHIHSRKYGHSRSVYYY